MRTIDNLPLSLGFNFVKQHLSIYIHINLIPSILQSFPSFPFHLSLEIKSLFWRNNRLFGESETKKKKENIAIGMFSPKSRFFCQRTSYLSLGLCMCNGVST
jgi:hypothetical protein